MASCVTDYASADDNSTTLRCGHLDLDLINIIDFPGEASLAVSGLIIPPRRGDVST